MSEQWMVMGVLSVLLLAVFAYVLVLERRIRNLATQQEQRIEKIRNELVAMNSAAIGVGQRLISAEKKLNAAVEKQERVADNYDYPALEPVVAAERAGMRTEVLAERYGLSEAEADLLALLKSHSVADHQAA